MSAAERKFRIGRERSCDIALAHDSVSRLHAELTFIGDGRLLLTDCNSTRGTYLVRGDGREKRLRQELISPLDQLRFGEVQLAVRDLIEALRLKFPRFEAPGPAPTPPSKPEPDQRPRPKGDRLVRCICGAVKPADAACPECGR